MFEFEIHAFESASRRVFLILAAYLTIVLSGVEAQTTKFQPIAAVPTSAEILDAGEAAMGTEGARASIRSISAIAACHGPKGDYETRIISDRNGNLSFQQFLSDHKDIEGILDSRGWQLDERGRSESIDAIEVSVLRGHEFPMMALDLRRRFHDFKSIGRAQFEGQATTQIAMTDDLGHPASAYFSLISHLPVGIITTNSRTEKPVTIRFDAWRLVCGVNLASHATILYGGETWVFDFKTLKLNAADNNAFQIPEAASGSGSLPSRDGLAQVNRCKCILTDQDRTAIRSTIEKYRTSWLAGDAEGVMGTFAEDAVLMPPQGIAPAVGREAIRKYWWPAGGPTTTITKLNITYEDIGGECSTAYARGRDEVGWIIEENGTRKSHGNSGTYLNVMRRLPDGSWRISHHMWDVDPSKNQ